MLEQPVLTRNKNQKLQNSRHEFSYHVISACFHSEIAEDRLSSILEKTQKGKPIIALTVINKQAVAHLAICFSPNSPIFSFNTVTVFVPNDQRSINIQVLPESKVPFFN